MKVTYTPGMKVIGLTRIRNEEFILQDTLDHMATFCDRVYLYDDASTDGSEKIYRAHPIVHGVIRNERWDPNRKRAEWQSRAAILHAAKKLANKCDWFVYMDADERIEFDFNILKIMPADVIAIRMKLFDYYITPQDKDLHYSQRQHLGPEYRPIIMAFRNLPTLDYSSPDQREVHLRSKGIIMDLGYVKHYGKAVSVQQWEDTCEYYGKFFPKYSAKWNARRGKAIHTISSFGNPLITWDEKDEKGMRLTKQIEKNSIYEHTSS